MANIAYIRYKPSEATAQILGFSNVIIEEFQAAGFDVTLSLFQRSESLWYG